MELIGGLVIIAILAGATGLGWWAKRHPSTDADEREWSDSIR